MKIYKKNALIVKSVIDSWKVQEIISEDQANRLNCSIEIVEFDWKKLSMLAILFSILSFIIAAISFIPELQEYCKDERVQCMFLAIIAASCYAFGAYRKAKWPEKIIVMKVYFFLVCCLPQLLFLYFL